MSTEQVITQRKCCNFMASRLHLARRMKHCLFVLLTFALSATACTSNSPSTLTTTTAPSGSLTTDTFTGTVLVGGSDIHNVVVSQTGEVDITLTAAGPPPTIFMGVGIGTISGSSCVFLSNGTTTAQAGTSPQLSGSTIAAGTYCVEVFDIGNQASPVTYSLTVVHS